MTVAMTAAMVVAWRWRRGEGGGDGGGAARAAAMAAARRGRRRWRGQWGESMDEAGRGGGEEEKTVALCGAVNLASTRCGEEGSGLVYYLT